MTTELILNNISKEYKNKKVINNISISLNKGEIKGLIGRNGSGKTTIMSIICGLSYKSEGELFLFSVDETLFNKKEVFKNVGSLIENPSFFLNYTALDNMILKCKCYGIRNIREYCYDLLQKVGLEDNAKQKVKTFSLGMKQRLGIAISLIGNPTLLILDEPINGLDPMGILEIRNIILNLNQKYGITILISSHILDELYKIASSFCIIDNGEVITDMKKTQIEEYCINNNCDIEKYYFDMVLRRENV